MKRILSISGIILIACLMQGCACKGNGSDQRVESAKQVDQQYADAFSKGDLDGVMAAYWNSPDLVVYPPDSLQAKGWDAVRENLGGALKSMPGAKLELTETHYTPVGDAVISWGLWKISFPNSRGSIPDVLGRYSAIEMKKDGKWVLVVDHISEPLTTPAPAPGKP